MGNFPQNVCDKHTQAKSLQNNKKYMKIKHSSAKYFYLKSETFYQLDK